MSMFGAALRRLRRERGLSLRALSSQVAYDYGYLAQIERGDRPATAGVVAACDRALEAGGMLVNSFEVQSGEAEMQRHTVLRALTAAAAAGPSLTSLEALRQGIGHAVDADNDSWQAVIVEYGHAYYLTSPAVMIDQVTADLSLLQQMMTVERGARLLRLMQVSSRQSVLLAMALSAAGNTLVAARWWDSARTLAERSGDLDTRVFVGAWEVVNGTYLNRPLAYTVERADATIALAGDRIDAAVAGVLAGRAQALALMGRVPEATAAVEEVARMTDLMPVDAGTDTGSLFGWPEHRLRHTESFVFTQVGRCEAAMRAQDRAFALYPTSQARLRTQVGLHRAACLIKRGEIADGLWSAADLLDRLPREHHTTVLCEVARQVLTSVPPAEQNRAEVRDVQERLAAGPAVT